MSNDFIKKFYAKHDLIKQKDAKHSALMKKMYPNYGKGRELTEKERNPRLKATKSKHSKFLGDNK